MSLVVGKHVGRFRVTEALWDNPGRGRYRGVAEVEPLGPVLIATTIGQALSLEQTRAELALDMPGIAELRAVDRMETALQPLCALVETEPAGKPLSSWQADGLGRDDVIAVGIDLVSLLARAHARGQALGGVRPELCYAERRDDALVLTEVAPRAIGFFATGGRLDAGNVPAFEQAFEPIEVLLVGRPPDPASDVFSLAATLGFLATGKHPFPGQSWAQQANAMASTRGGWPDRDDSLLRVLERALVPPAERPSAAELSADLASLG